VRKTEAKRTERESKKGEGQKQEGGKHKYNITKGFDSSSSGL
jgi:hypothetical protein